VAIAQGGYMTDYLSNESVKLIQTIASTPNANPFFLTLAYNAPHNPLQALKSDYEDPALKLIPSHHGRVYAAMIKALDRGVGEILKALKDTNQWDNTIVIFTSDNGGASYIDLPLINHPYRGWKATFFEGGLRVPLYMQWPAMIDASTEVTQTVSHVDIFPTLFAAAAMMNESSSPVSSSEAEHVENSNSSKSIFSYFSYATKTSENKGNQSLSEASPSYLALITECEFDKSVQLTALHMMNNFEAALSSLQIRWEPTLTSINVKIHRVVEAIDSFFSRLLATISVSRPKAILKESESKPSNISMRSGSENASMTVDETSNSSSASISVTSWLSDGICGLVVKELLCPAGVNCDSHTFTEGISYIFPHIPLL